METPPPMCLVCAHYDETDVTCSAFPDGIPAVIVDHEFDHREPYDGDAGIMFDPAPNMGSDEVEEVLATYE